MFKLGLGIALGAGVAYYWWSQHHGTMDYDLGHIRDQVRDKTHDVKTTVEDKLHAANTEGYPTG